MSYHVIHIDNPCHISVDTKRLMIKRADAEPIFLIPDDCAVIILNHYQITISHHALVACANAGTLLVTADTKHLPIALNIPININHQGAKRPWLQAQHLHSDMAKNWWAHIIERKIYGQAQLLLSIDNMYHNRLFQLAKRTDVVNAYQQESTAAALYWQEFFKFLQVNSKREKQQAEHPINQHLNYGYAIIRSLMARALAGAGLCLNFGMGHYRKDNPFNLVEDMMEPYRPLIDNIVLNMHQQQAYDSITSESKAQLVTSILDSNITLAGKKYRLLPAIEKTITQFSMVLEKPKTKLLFPEYQ